MTRTLLLIGCGYAARAVAARMAARGWRVLGTTRRGPAPLQAAGIEARLWPGEDISGDIAGSDAILSSVAPQRGRDPVLDAYARALAAAPARFIGYFSTTAVYGDAGGGWVDEASPLRPGSRRGRERIAAENGWRALYRDHARPVHLFRLAGIYGPGRGPLEKLRQGAAQAVIKPDQVFNRIHVEDVARAVEAAIAAPRPGAVWNLADDEAAPPQDVLDHAADLLGLPRPPRVAFDAAPISAMARDFYSENKRVANARIARELGFALRYRDYRAGLAACLEAGA